MTTSQITASKQDKFVARYQQRFNLEIDNDWSARESKLTILQKFLDGSIYDNLAPYHMEYMSDAGSYVKLSQRRPSVIYNLCKLIVDDTVSMLFGDDHFPIVRCSEHEKTTNFLQYITQACQLKQCMINAADIGSIGSVCVLIKVLKGKFYYDVLNTKDLTPIFDSQEPDNLIELSQKRKVDGASLRAFGYNVLEDDKNKQFYFVRKWTETEEIYYQPYKIEDEKESFQPSKDDERSTVHGLGFVPIVWIKNLPHSHHIDGRCTFESIIDISIEIDYQLSQLGRLLKYNSDPTLVIKNASHLEGAQLIKGLGPLNVGEDGDAYYLQLTTGATNSVIDYVKTLREFALEIAHGNRMNPEKFSAAHSGKAMQMLQSSLISLVEKMRLSYGDSGLLKIYQMTLKIYRLGEYDFDYELSPDESNDCENHLSLDWPDWYPLLPIDRLQQAQALQVLLDKNVISQETATNVVASQYNVKDIDQELKDIEIDQKKSYDDNANGDSVERKPSKPVEQE